MFANHIDIFVCLFGDFLFFKSSLHFVLFFLNNFIYVCNGFGSCFSLILLSYPLPSHAEILLSNVCF